MILYFNTRSTGSNSWDNTGNWFEDPDGNAPYGNTPNPGDDLYFQSDCDTNIPTALDYYITINEFVSFTLGGATGYTQSGYSITCYGVFNINSDNILNSSVFIVNAGGVFNNYGTITSGVYNSGTFNNNSIGNIAAFTNSGIINNSGGFTNSGGSTNTGTLNNNSTFANYSNITNSGTFNNNSTFTNAAGTFTNNSTFANAAGIFTNNSTFINNGIATVAETAYLSFRPTSSSFINNGTFTFGSKYTTRFIGEIFPQVPSSASWGNALL